uniref:Damage-control phosphatase ARMT1 n=1 Tax=Amblyomma aureolatum TaxID=187763 RepID=A0A1E1X9W6_9ACAR
MATPSPKSRQSKTTDSSEKVHQSTAASQQHSASASGFLGRPKSPQAHAVDMSQSEGKQQAEIKHEHSAAKSSMQTHSRDASQKSASRHSVGEPETPTSKEPAAASRQAHQHRHTPSKSAAPSDEPVAAQRHGASEKPTPASRQSVEQTPTAAPRGHRRQQPSETLPSKSATPVEVQTGAGSAEPRHTDSDAAVVPAWHTEIDGGPFCSTPSQRSAQSASSELGAPDKNAEASELEARSKQKTPISSGTPLTGTPTRVSEVLPGELPAEERLAEEPPAETPGTVAQQRETERPKPIQPDAQQQPARVPLWKQSLPAPPTWRVTQKEGRKPMLVVPPEALPNPPPLSAKNTKGFAYKTVRDRLPVILTKVIDTVFRDRMEIGRVMGAEAREETKLVVGRLAKLRNEMVTNKPMVRIEDDFEDAEVWNSVLDCYMTDKGCPPRWYEAPWLYIETYYYRRIFEAFQMTTRLKDYDPFSKLKRDALYGSFNAVRILCDFVRQNTHREATVETLKQTTYRLIEVSLWGNRCDLSLSCGADSSGQAGSLQQTDRLRPYIISNHADKLWKYLCKLRERNQDGEPTRLHCVMDNAGYELATDLALLDFLHETGYVAIVTIHVKAIPWYVSDVMRRDLFWTLREMQDSDHSATQALSERCHRRIMDGTWFVMDDVFWTQSFDYAEMVTRRPDLYKLLQSADLLIFKGDLNYRKLVGDLDWDPTVSFEHALRGFKPTFLCALRTLKADTAAGIEPVIASEVAQRSPDWMVTGEYAVIQCAGARAERLPTSASPLKDGTTAAAQELGTSTSLHTAASGQKERNSDVLITSPGAKESSTSGAPSRSQATPTTSAGHKGEQQNGSSSAVPKKAKEESKTSCSVAQEAQQENS